MGGSAEAIGAVVSIVSTLAGGALAGSRPSGGSSSAAMLKQQEKESEEARRREAEERRKRQEQRAEDAELAKRRLAGLSGRESTLATGGAGLLTQASVRTNQLKGKLGQ